MPIPLQNQTEQLARALEAAQVGVWKWQPETGDFSILCTLPGLKLADSVLAAGQLPLMTMVSPVEQQALRIGLESLLNGTRQDFFLEVLLSDEDGERAWVDLRVLVIESQTAGRARELMGVMRNVQVQKSAEAEMQLACLRQAAAEEAGETGTMVLSLSSNTVALSDRARALLRLGPLEGVLDVEALYGAIDVQDRGRLREQLRFLAENGGRLDVSFSVSGAGEVPVQLAGSFDYSLAGVSDAVIGVIRLLGKESGKSKGVILDEQSFFEAMNLNPSPVWLLSESTLKLLAVNDAAAQLYGSGQKDMIGIGLNQLLVEQDLVDVRHRLLDVKSRTGLVGQWRHLTATGSELPADISFSRIQYAGMPAILLVTRLQGAAMRVGADSALKEALLKGVIDSAMDGIVVVDDAQKVVIFNRAAERIFGLRADQMIGQELDRLIPNELRDVHRRHMREFSEHHRTRRMNGEFLSVNALRADGSKFPIEASISKVILDGQRLFTVTVRDVTEKRRQEAERARMEGQLRQSQKVESVAILAGEIAHQLNNHLAAVFAQIDLAETGSQEPREFLEALAEIKEAGLRAKNLARQIMAFGKNKKAERQELSLQAEVPEAVSLLGPVLPEGITLETDISEDAPSIVAVRVQVLQVVLDLINFSLNSIGRRSGRITIKTYACQLTREEAAGLSLQDGGKFVAMAIATDVSDILDGLDSHLFSPLYVGQDTKGGMALGLGVVLEIMKRHGGAAHASALPGGGLQVTVYFPAHQPGDNPGDTPRKRKSIGRGERILFVDDELSLVKPAELLLSRLGFHVQAMTDADAAVKAVTADPFGYAALVTDLYMPKVSGLDLIAAVRAVSATIPVVLCSGFMNEDQRVAAVALGVGEFVHKPYTGEELALVLSRLLH